jgi:ABC-type Na+ efflux pump permease subunit
MWNFLMALFVGSAVGVTRTGQRLVRPVLILFVIGVLIAGFVYACSVFRAISERTGAPHVHSYSTH